MVALKARVPLKLIDGSLRAPPVVSWYATLAAEVFEARTMPLLLNGRSATNATRSPLSTGNRSPRSDRTVAVGSVIAVRRSVPDVSRFPVKTVRTPSSFTEKPKAWLLLIEGRLTTSAPS